MTNHTIKEINFNTFINNIETEDVETVPCEICNAMGGDCVEWDHCPTLSDLAEFLTGEIVVKKSIRLTQLEYDILYALAPEYGDEPLQSCPIISDLIGEHFRWVKDKSLTVSMVITCAKVVD